MVDLIKIAHGCGIITVLIYALCGILAIINPSSWRNILMLFVNFIIAIFIGCLECPEIFPCQCLIPVKNCMQCLSTPCARFVVYLVICLSFFGSGYGYTWIASICCVICCCIYGYITFCFKPVQSN